VTCTGCRATDFAEYTPIVDGGPHSTLYNTHLRKASNRRVCSKYITNRVCFERAYYTCTFAKSVLGFYVRALHMMQLIYLLHVYNIIIYNSSLVRYFIKLEIGSKKHEKYLR